jgi:hypothetical protein
MLPRLINTTVLFVWKQFEFFKLIEVAVLFIAITSDYPATVCFDQRGNYIADVHGIVFGVLLCIFVGLRADRHIVIFLALRTINQRAILSSAGLPLPLWLLLFGQKRRIPICLNLEQIVQSSGLIVPIIFNKRFSLSSLNALFLHFLEQSLIHFNTILPHNDALRHIVLTDLIIPFTFSDMVDSKPCLRIRIQYPFQDLFTFG